MSDYYPTLPAGQVSHLTPQQEAAVRNYQHDHVGPGPCTHPMANPNATWDGKCARHK